MSTRLILIGGFLGAGKTTLVLKAAQMLLERGQRVGLVTNDQGHTLVDTALARGQTAPVTEVAGGCFCCRFPDLLESLQELERVAQPGVILAEPVGSCTDLMATVLRPLLAYHAETYEIAPLTVLLDPTRRLAGYGQEVSYLYRKQLAEAEIIALSKGDLVTIEKQEELARRLRDEYAPVQVQTLSAYNGEGVAAWLETVLSARSQFSKVLEIDYQQYAEAEAHLGWLNVGGALRSQHLFSTRNWITHLLSLLDQSLSSQGAMIAHVKVQATTPAGAVKASLTQSGGTITWDAAPAEEPTDTTQFILNARVHTTPTILEQAIRRTFAEVTPPPDFHYEFTHFECFSPASPQPTHRLAALN
jgi:G3E family GTPase